MLRFLIQLRVTTKLTLLTVISALSFAVFAAYAYDTITRVKVNGPVYERIVQGKDLIADILPPPEYIIESYLVVLQLLDETEPAQVNRLLKESARLLEEYNTRHAVWDKDLEPSRMRDAMVDESYKAAVEFYRMRDQEFLPAINSGDREKARRLARGPLKTAYETHRKAIDEVVRLAGERNAADEQGAAGFMRIRTIILFIVGLVSLAVIAILGRAVGRAILVPLETTSATLHRLAQGELLSVGEQLSGSADSTSMQASAASQSGEEVRSIMESTAAATEEIASGIQEIAHNAEDASEFAATALMAAEEARRTVSELDQHSSDIGKVVATISTIAMQINLLALNATIEAARAGDAGRGFSVVAGQVKKLADDARNSANDISHRVEAIVGDMSSSARTMVELIQVIQKVADLQKAIAQAVRQQASAADQIGQNVNSAAGNTARISENVNSVAASARKTLDGAHETGRVAGELVTISQQLRGLI